MDGMQPGEGWSGKAFRVWLICGSRRFGDDSKQRWVCNSVIKMWLRGVTMLLIKQG